MQTTSSEGKGTKSRCQTKAFNIVENVICTTKRDLLRRLRIMAKRILPGFNRL